MANTEVYAKEAVQLWDTCSAVPALDDPSPEFCDPKLIKGQDASYAVSSALQHLHNVVHAQPKKQPLNQSELTLEQLQTFSSQTTQSHAASTAHLAPACCPQHHHIQTWLSVRRECWRMG